MNEADLTSRWTFCWVYGDHPVLRRLDDQIVWASPVPGISYVERPGVFRAIVFGPEAWKLDDKTWWRKDLWSLLPTITNSPAPGPRCRKRTVLLWSRLPEVVSIRSNIRLVTEEEALEEAARAWAWTIHIVRKPIRTQKIGGLAKTYEEWTKANPKPKLPESPFSGRSNKPRPLRRIKPQSPYD